MESSDVARVLGLIFDDTHTLADLAFLQKIISYGIIVFFVLMFTLEMLSEE